MSDIRWIYKSQLLPKYQQRTIRKWNLKHNTIYIRTKKYLGINLTKPVQDLHKENYKTLLKEIKEEQNKCRDTTCSRIRRLNVVKTSVLYWVYRFNVIPIKMPAWNIHFEYFNILIINFIWKYKRLRIVNTTLRRTKLVETAPLNLKTLHAATIIKTAWHWRRNERIKRKE